MASSQKKPASKTDHSIVFDAPLERFRSGLKSFYVAVPFSVEERFGVRGHLRVKGTINGLQVDRALIPGGDGTHHILVPVDMRRQLKVRLGDLLHVSLVKNEEPEKLEIPEELQAALELEPEALEIFLKFRPGMRRSIVYWVASGKKTETRVQRAVEVLRRIQSGEFMFGGQKA